MSIYWTLGQGAYVWDTEEGIALGMLHLFRFILSEPVTNFMLLHVLRLTQVEIQFEAPYNKYNTDK